MNLIRVLLWPISILYGWIVAIRNRCFDYGIFKSTSFASPLLIGVGNLTAGGTGKTPHVEYLVKLLAAYKLATLSRGYGRKTSGFLEASNNSTAMDIGDEPRQFRHRFPEHVCVAVDEKRVHGVNQLRQKYPDLDVVILDDVFQHRKIKPGLQILLTDYARLFYNDQLLPTGLLRESKSGAARADIIIVTKTPNIFSPLERKRIMRELNPLPHQQIYCSTIRYGDFIPLGQKSASAMLGRDYYFERGYTVVLLTGIANSQPLEFYLRDKAEKLITVRYKDHHQFSVADLQKLQTLFAEIPNEKKIILTTEKDAMRLDFPELREQLAGLPVHYIPIEITFHDKDTELFNQQILDYVRKNSGNSRIH
jgi:tetraacyldisaccharide 4'-kinase